MQAVEFLLLADLLPEGMLLVAADGKVLAVNREAARQLERTSQQLVGRNIGELTGLQADELLTRIRPCIRSRNPTRLALNSSQADAFIAIHACVGFLVTPAKEGQLAQFIIRLSAASSQSSRFLALNREIDKHRRLLKKLQQSRDSLYLSEKLYRDLIETTAAIAWEFDIETQRFLYMGPRIFELTGFPAEQWIDLDSWAAHIHPDDRERAVNFCQIETREGQDHSFEYRTIAADGRVVWIRDEVTVITRFGRPVLMRGYFFDITNNKQTEEALRRSQKMDAIGQLAGGIAHDFNNILGIITGNLDLLERQITADEMLQKRIDGIKHSTERASTLTRQLLGFSRREAVSVKATDVNKVINAMETLITQSLTPQVEVEYHCEKDLWKTDIDPGDFEDALLNLMLNARDAMAGRGNLTIETQNCTLDENYCLQNSGVEAGEYVLLAVSDNGVGISKEQQARIFDPFFTTKEQGKGTGLGLSMVFGFVKRSQGNIKVYSEPGTGTTFRLYLPRSKANEYVEEMNPADKNELHGGMETILVVDDELALLELVEELLQHLGYKVLTANNANQALQILSEVSGIDLLFSDVVMPGGINGYELAEQAISRCPDIKVLLTSGYTEMAVARNGQARFNAHLLSKPYTQIELAKKIRERLTDTQNGNHQ